MSTKLTQEERNSIQETAWGEVLDLLDQQAANLLKQKEEVLKNGVANPQKAKENLNKLKKVYNEIEQQLDNLDHDALLVVKHQQETASDVLKFQEKHKTSCFTDSPIIAAILGLKPTKSQDYRFIVSRCPKCDCPINPDGICEHCLMFGDVRY